MSYSPCENPNCESYGKPHPNCRCHGGMAEGGEAEPFCSKDQKHEDGCQYFKMGGDVDTTESPSVMAEGDNAVPESDLPDEVVAQEVPASDIPDDVRGKEVPVDDIPDEALGKDKYSTPGQKVLTAIEGAGQGFAGPIATGIELGASKLGVPGFSDEDIKGRQAANPELHTAAEVAGVGAGFIPPLAPFSLAGKIGKAAGLIKVGEEASKLAKLGTAALRGVVQGGLFQASDEATKLAIGQGDPNDSVASKLADAGQNILLSSAGGGLLGGAGGAAANKLASLAESKAGSKIHSLLAGLGEAATGSVQKTKANRAMFDEAFNSGMLDKKFYDKGVQLYNSKMGSHIITGGIATKIISDSVDAARHDDLQGGMTKVAQDIGLGLGLKALSKVGGKALMWAITNGETNPRKLFQLIEHADEVNAGLQKANRAVENVFRTGAQQAFNHEDLAKKREKLDLFLENGGHTENVRNTIYDANAPKDMPEFAKGGDVKASLGPQDLDGDGIADHYPDQNIALQAAKGRISGYLQSLKPQKNQPKLAFDDEPDQGKQKKSYKRALNMAIEPLGIMDKIRRGTLEPEHVQHFDAMHPELRGLLQKKIVDQITKAQMKGDKPSYKVRQGLSLFMGVPLSGEMSPQNMMAAQATFQAKQQQQGGGQPPKKTSALAKSSSSYMTANQAALARQQKQ